MKTNASLLHSLTTRFWVQAITTLTIGSSPNPLPLREGLAGETTMAMAADKESKTILHHFKKGETSVKLTLIHY